MQRRSQLEAGLGKSLVFHYSSWSFRGRVAMVSGLSQYPFPLGDKYRPSPTEFLAQPQTLVFLG